MMGEIESIPRVSVFPNEQVKLKYNLSVSVIQNGWVKSKYNLCVSVIPIGWVTLSPFTVLVFNKMDG